MATVTSYGAAGTVTGSCHLLQIDGIKCLIDCGMFQGNAEHKNDEPFGLDPTKIDYLILTHGHIDHIGRVPKLVKEGFRGTIIATQATIDIASIMLLDAAKIMYEEYRIQLRKAKREGMEESVPKPLYEIDDVANTFKLKRITLEYEEAYEVTKSFSLTLRCAGHILGSAFVECMFEEEAIEKRIVFSGDIGGPKRLVIDPLSYGGKTQTLYVESTYGDRLHRDLQESIAEFKNVIIETMNRGGNVMIPSFALERTQEILSILRVMFDSGELRGVKVFLDSPLAIKATNLYNRYPTLLNEENELHAILGNDPFTFEALTLTQTPKQSQSINNIQQRAIIIAGSGMCTGGRILHHFKHRLWEPHNTLIFVGYQVNGTLGRKIIDGADHIYVRGEKIAVRAKVHTINGFSAHGDRDDIIEWIERFEDLRTIYLIHGEQEKEEAFKKTLKEKFPDKKVHIVKEKESIYI